MSDDQQTLKLKIAKKAYVFDVKKRFAASRNFAVKKAPENPAEDLKEKIKGLLEKKKLPLDSSAPGEKSASAPQKPPQKAAGAELLKAAAITAAVVVIGFLGLLAMLPPGGAIEPSQTPMENLFTGKLSFAVDQAMVLSVEGEDAAQRTGYFLISYQAANLSGLNFTAKLYPQQPPTQVFILDYPRDSGSSYPVFKKYLVSGLARRGITANEIDIGMVRRLPPGAVLLVPTGYFPKELLGVDSEFDYQSLLGRGATIIYIGLPFDNQALGRDGLAVQVSYKKIAFDKKARPKSTDGFRLFNAQYSAAPSQTEAGNDLSAAPPIYGSISAIKYKAGTMLLLPQSLDGGWRERDVSGLWSEKGELAAQDLVRLISDEPWVSSLASASSPAPPGNKTERKLSLFTGKFESDAAFVKLAADAADSDGSPQRSLDVFQVEKTQKGKLVPSEPQAVPYYLSGQRTRLNVALRENSSAQVKLYVEMYKDGRLLQRTDLEPGLTTPTTDKSIDMQVDAEPGNYVVMVADEQGKVYAACELVVTDLDIAINQTNWNKGRFSFLLSSAGQPVEPRSLSITFDGKEEARYSPSSLHPGAASTEVEYLYPGKIGSGSHRFLFTIGTYSKSLTLPYDRTPPFWENPIFILLSILAAVVAAMGAVLRRPDAVRYGLDIPDFPPMSTIKIPVKRETVREIFESVNSSYSWQRMPLRADEIKNGFRKLTYNGKPILIGDFNLERILAKMAEEGLVKEEAGYFGLSSWEKESDHSIHYLAIYRIMRNVFVNNAVKFSKLDAMADCDMKAIAGNEEIYLHIMEEPQETVVHRALATAKKGTTLIIFKTSEGRDAFRASLTSTSKLAVGLKMEVDGGRIMLFSAKNEVSAYLKGIIK